MKLYVKLDCLNVTLLCYICEAAVRLGGSRCMTVEPMLPC